MFPTLLLAVSILSQCSLISADSSITWLQPQRSAIVKLDLWELNHDNPDSYRKTSAPSAAVLLQFSMTADNKTLRLDDTPILPLQNYHIPPLLSAYQVPIDVEESAILALAEGGHTGKDIRGRVLHLDYDRLVHGDPTGGPPFHYHMPVLRFRIMGFGTGDRDHVVDVQSQKVIQMVLKDRNNGTSDDPMRSYFISSVDILSPDEVYNDVHQGPDSDVEKECTKWTWTCPDGGVYEAYSPYRTPYRFVWRSRFDEYGRIGSLRHDILQRIHLARQSMREDPRNAILVALAILSSTVLAIVGGVKAFARPSASSEDAAVKPAKRKSAAKSDTRAEGKESGEEEEEEEEEDEDEAWLAEQSQQVGTIDFTVDEAVQLVAMLPDEDEDTLPQTQLDEDADVVPKKSKTRKRVGFADQQ